MKRNLNQYQNLDTVAILEALQTWPTWEWVEEKPAKSLPKKEKPT